MTDQTPPPAYSPEPTSAPTPPPYAAPAYGGPVSPPQGLSVASLILGIVGVLLSFVYGIGFLPGLAAVITGHIAQKRQPHAKGLWLTGLITGYVAILISVIAVIIVVIFFVAVVNNPAFQQGIQQGIQQGSGN